MKKRYTILLSLLMCFVLCACGGEQNADGPRLESAGSEIYTQDEIADAAEVVIQLFDENFAGCTLTALRYPCDDAVAFQAWAQQYDADQAIVLVSDFNVDETAGDGSLEPNSTYEDWQWILVRNQGGSWEAKTWGYG